MALEPPDKDLKLTKKSSLTRTPNIEYPYVSGHSTINGISEYCYQNPNNPENTNTEKIDACGSVQMNEIKDGKGFFSRLFSGEWRNYIGGGSSNHGDGQQENSGESNIRTTAKKDMGREAGGNSYSGSGGKQIGGQKEGSFKTNSGFGEKTYSSSEGDRISDHKGNIHKTNEGDSVNTIKGNKIDIISNGEYAIHVQSGNMDTHVKGKSRVYSDGELIVKSLQKITLQVGESRIIIQNDSITLVIGENKGIKITSGDIVVSGTSWIGQPNINTKTGLASPPFHSP